MSLTAIILLVLFGVLLLLMFVGGLCKVASDADDESDSLFEQLTRKDLEPPSNQPILSAHAHPSVRRALGRG